jgi:hypothetical protein
MSWRCIKARNFEFHLLIQFRSPVYQSNAILKGLLLSKKGLFCLSNKIISQPVALIQSGQIHIFEIMVRNDLSRIIPVQTALDGKIRI